MFRNYFKTACRNLIRNKTFGFINIFGLAISMAFCLLIITLIYDQKSYDQFLSNYDRIYRIHTQSKSGEDKPTATSAFSLGDELNNAAGVESAVSLYRNLGGDLYHNNKYASVNGYFAEANFFQVLNYELKEGDKNTALKNPRSVIISQEIAQHLFGKNDAMGKLVRLNHTGVSTSDGEPEKESNFGDFEVTGVFKNLKGKTTLHFDVLGSMSTVMGSSQEHNAEILQNNWDNVWNSYTYVLMRKGYTKNDLQRTLNGINSKHYPTPDNSNFTFNATPLKEIPGQLVSNETATILPNVAILFLGILCLIIMLCACLNYTNLSIARSLTRIKEVGVRKVSGASKKQIFQQFIFESIYTSFLALILATCLVFLLQKVLAGLWLNKFFDFSFQFTPEIYLTFLGFSVIIGLISGLLPAAYISLFNPVEIFNKLNTIKGFKRLTVRKVLLTTQFIVSFIFVVSATLIFAQTKHVFNFDYGFNQNNVINIKLFKGENYDRFVQAVSSQRDIMAVSGCTFPPSSGANNSTYAFSATRKDSIKTGFIDIDQKALEVWNIPLIAGQNLPEIASDSIDNEVLINQRFVKDFGFNTPADAVGQHLWLGDHSARISGVVQDFQYLEVTRGIEPLLLRNRKNQFGYATVRIALGKESVALQTLESTWNKVNPDTKFEYVFFDDQLREFHSMLKDAATIIGLLSFIAVIISCLGLLGMAVYTAETKRKEVGIRKILGSSIGQIVLYLSKSYLYLLGIAILIATPLAYILNNTWLQFFVSRIRISPLILLTSIGGLSLICLLIVGLQAWNVSRINPVKSLRTE